MAKISTNISIDAETKTKAQLLLSDFGMDLSTAVNIFLKQMIYEGAFPFAISRDIPNRQTLEAMNEAKEMASNPKKYKRYSDVDSMMEDILDEA